MSLRGFHILFVTICTILSLFLVIWGFLLAPADAQGVARILGGVGILGLLVMPVYGVYFYRKAKKLIL